MPHHISPSNALSNAFTLIQEPHGTHWLHADGRHFVSHFEAVDGVRAAYFQAYTSKEQPPKGRMPWTVDNRRIGRDGYGYPSLEAAMQACGALFNAEAA